MLSIGLSLAGRPMDGVGRSTCRIFTAVGGLDNALSLHAEEALQADTLAEIRKIFQRLTRVDSGQRRVRNPALLSEVAASTGILPARVFSLLEPFKAQGREFVTFSDGPNTADPRIDLSHESLIRQ